MDPAPAPSSVHARRGARRAAWEIAAAYGLILMVEWTPRPLQRFLWLVAAVGIALIVWRSFDGWQRMGFRAANLGRSSWIVGAALLLAAVSIFIAARHHALLVPAGPLHFLHTYSAYAIWTGVQEFLLQSVFLLRFLRLIPRGWLAALAAAALFAMAHLPNPVLVPITFVWGVAACLLFLHYRNVVPLMLAHAVLGITVAMAVPGPVDHNMRVGLGYLTYSRHMHSHPARSLAQPK